MIITIIIIWVVTVICPKFRSFNEKGINIIGISTYNDEQGKNAVKCVYVYK